MNQTMEISEAKQGCGVSLRLSRWNVLAAAGVLAFCGGFLLLERLLGWEEEDTGSLPIAGGETLLFLGMGLAVAFLCLLEVRLPVEVRRGIGWAFVLLMPLATFLAVDVINSTNVFSFSTKKILANYICYLMVFALVYAITRRVWATAMAGGLIFLVFGIANYFVVQFRGQPILPWDIQSFGTAVTVAGGYQYVPTQQMALTALGYFGVLALCVKLCPRGKEGASRRFRITERAVSLVISGALFLMLFPMDILTDMGISVWAWNQKTSSELTGITAGFFANIQFVMVDKPEGYSASRVQNLGEELAQEEEPELLGRPEGLPTVIAIMNESFTDMQSVGDVEFTPDNLPFLHSLQESGEVIWGTAYSSVYGGNTCNSEYEFLTGNTTAFLPTGSKPYQQYVDSEQTALPSILKSYGYRCVAVHPGNRDAWSRDTAYPYLGFDEFIDVSAFDVDRTLTHRLTSDVSTYDQLIYEYENRQEGEPLFLFGVTIQNHGGYEDENFQTTVRVKEAAGEYPQTEQYLSLTKKSDQALEYLLDYFAQREDPVVVLFFGDHWPNLEEEYLTDLLGTDSTSLGLKDMMREYQVPFVIWANYPLESQEIEAVSLNYLSGLLLRAAGLEGTDYTKFLEQLRQEVPVITAVGTMDKDGSLYAVGESTPYDDLLNDYAVLQYNNAFGGSGKVSSIFTR